MYVMLFFFFLSFKLGFVVSFGFIGLWSQTQLSPVANITNTFKCSGKMGEFSSVFFLSFIYI